MVKVYLIHGWGGNPNSERWFGWLKQECEKRNIKIKKNFPTGKFFRMFGNDHTLKGVVFNVPDIIIPAMPDTDNPKINEWIDKLKEIIENDEKIYLVGHSIGCQTIMRFLEGLNDEKIAGAVFVAGWFNLLDTAYGDEGEREIAKPWLETPIDYEKVRSNVDRILAIFSTNDNCVPISDSKLFKGRLGAEIVVKENEGHFNDTKKIEEIMEFIK